MKRAFACGAVTKKRNGNAVAGFELSGDGRAGRDRQSGADDTVGAKHPDVEVGDVHRTALAFAVAVAAAK